MVDDDGPLSRLHVSRRRKKGSSGGLGVLGFFVKILAFGVIGGGSLGNIACRAMEGDGGYDIAMG